MTTAAGTSDPIRAALKVCMAYRDVTQATATIATGIPKRTMIRRMQVGGWTVAEVQALAAYFGVSVGALITGPGEVMRELSATTGGYRGANSATTSPRPVLAAVPVAA